MENSLTNIILISALPRVHRSLEITKAAGGVALKYRINTFLYQNKGWKSKEIWFFWGIRN